MKKLLFAFLIFNLLLVGCSRTKSTQSGISTSAVDETNLSKVNNLRYTAVSN
ncbi:MAG: hypothetical protein VW397_02905 [Candidatus Margulisiibacteriota bacterium]